jgi:DNA primase
VRGVPEAVVSTPLRWNEVPDAEPSDFTLATVPKRFARLGDVHAGIDDAVFSLEPLLEWADRDEHQT